MYFFNKGTMTELGFKSSNFEIGTVIPWKY